MSVYVIETQGALSLALKTLTQKQQDRFMKVYKEEYQRILQESFSEDARQQNQYKKQ